VDPAQPVFFYDLGSPECYLAAEQVMAALPVVPEWEPVLEAGLTGARPRRDLDRADVERRAFELGLQPVRWPPRLPTDTGQAMLAATYAKRVGRAVAFSLAAFRQAFAGGRDLGEQSTVLIAAAACEMHPTALLKAIALRSVTEALEAAGRRAAAAEVRELPAIAAGAQVFSGPDAVAEAAAALAADGVPGPGRAR
jgi:2-hydroxychromene-2-carboxylate isomerase